MTILIPAALVFCGLATLLHLVSVTIAIARYPLHGALRDLLLPCIWFDGLVGTDFVWRGNAMSIVEDEIDEIVEGGGRAV